MPPRARLPPRRSPPVACGRASAASWSRAASPAPTLRRSTGLGFLQIRLRFDLQHTATDEELATLLRLTERYCVVYQTINAGTQLDVALA